MTDKNTVLSIIKTWLETASNNPNNLYVITYNATDPIAITVTIATPDGKQIKLNDSDYDVVYPEVTVTPSEEPKTDNSLLNKVDHNSYITGYDDFTFRPNKSMTRAEVVTVFARLLKVKTEISNDNPFTDIEGHWAYYGIVEATIAHEYDFKESIEI